MTTKQPVEGVLFDLDGTLADTAPDLAAALNRVRGELDLPPLPLATIRPVVSLGTPGMLQVGLGLTSEHSDFQHRREQLLAFYAQQLCAETRLFPGVSSLLETLDSANLPWGVVTNKPQGLARPLMEALGLDKRSGCLIGGDTLAEKKPHPAPILKGCELTGISAKGGIYVVDAERDIEAGRAAGCRTVVALYGYIPNDSHPADWQADGAINSADELLELAWFATLGNG